MRFAGKDKKKGEARITKEVNGADGKNVRSSNTC
jgi:hypothetical protein